MATNTAVKFSFLVVLIFVPSAAGWWQDIFWTEQRPENCPYQDNVTHVCSELREENFTCVTVACCDHFKNGDVESGNDVSEYDDESFSDEDDYHVYYYGRTDSCRQAACDMPPYTATLRWAHVYYSETKLQHCHCWGGQTTVTASTRDRVSGLVASCKFQVIVTVGAAVGALALLALLAAVVYCCCRKSAPAAASASPPQPLSGKTGYFNNIYALPVDVKLPPYSLNGNPDEMPPQYVSTQDLRVPEVKELPPPSYSNPEYGMLGDLDGRKDRDVAEINVEVDDDVYEKAKDVITNA
ncbi:hypothetical protein MAR_012026 [Mya arenaria]|uniref:Uncharacterized protein n=1 Tax=Mya arenaria TaxID=6604 RepID=A0ABY7FZ32_MYAAR|nr:hypothetical protein MAR_012026 [Mya arenaria]